MKQSGLWQIRKVLEDLYEVREAVSPGRYQEEQLKALSRSLRWTAKEFKLNKAQLARSLLFSPSSMSNAMTEQNLRLVNFLRLTNNLIAFLEDKIANDPLIPPVYSKGRSDWRTLKSNAANKIARLSRELSELLDIVRYSNSLAMSDSILPPELKAQLIALLETALAQLKSPMIEVSLLSKIGGWLPKLGKKFGTQAGEKAIEKLATDAGAHLVDLIESSVL